MTCFFLLFFSELLFFSFFCFLDSFFKVLKTFDSRTRLSNSFAKSSTLEPYFFPFCFKDKFVFDVFFYFFFFIFFSEFSTPKTFSFDFFLALVDFEKNVSRGFFPIRSVRFLYDFEGKIASRLVLDEILFEIYCDT